MATDDDKPVGGARHDGGDAAEAFAPPERQSGLRRNWMMLGVVIILVLAVALFFVALSVR